MVKADWPYRRLSLLTAATLAGMLWSAGAAFAAEPATRKSAGEAATRPVRPPGGTLEGKRLADKPADEGYWPWVRTLGALAVVAALIFAVRFVLRRLAGTSHVPARPKALEVLARTPLGPRQQFVIVRFGRRLVLVGSGPAGMSSLAEITDGDEIAELLGEMGAGKAEAFADALRRHQEDKPGGSVRGLADKIRSQLSSKKEDEDR